MSESLAELQNLKDFVVKKGNGVKGRSQTDLKSITVHPAPWRKTGTNPRRSTKIHTHKIDVQMGWARSWRFNLQSSSPLRFLSQLRFFRLPVEERRKNSPSPTVQLRTTSSLLVEKVVEWKYYLFHFCDDQEIDDSKLWHSVSRWVFCGFIFAYLDVSSS